jgi:superfamily II DNA or RNA helicase
MNNEFKGWAEVSARLLASAADQERLANERGESGCRLNHGQRESLLAMAARIPKNGLILADEVGMGKTRIAVELARSVIESGGRVAILVPAGLGYQWQAELRDGKVEAPLILRSLWQYLAAWEFKSREDQQPWFNKQVVVISHAFTNWRLGENSDPWRWALLPELYARWRKKTSGRLPRGYNEKDELSEAWVKNAARSICEAIPEDEQHPAWQHANELNERTPWPGALQGSEYGRDRYLRPCLERAVGLGLGIFDLVVIDEAHKSRGSDSGLSRLLDRVILISVVSRRLAMTATPVELDISQWEQTLGRIKLDADSLPAVKQVLTRYAEAVKRVCQCPSNQEARDVYRQSAQAFQKVLSPNLLRRDKREDPAVQLFAKHSGLPINHYRRETEVTVETRKLNLAWKRAVCAAEALSIVTSQADDSIAKRLRLTLGNGYGIAALLDNLHDEPQNPGHPEFDNRPDKPIESGIKPPETKREARAQWWLERMKNPFVNSDDALFEHPAIVAAVEYIEGITARGEKVLAFGRFTRPLRALVDLLNAREMLRSLQSGRPWPQSKVHGAPSDNMDRSEWPALRAAHRQLCCAISLENIDQRLEEQYKEIESHRKSLQRNLIARIERGFLEYKADQRTKSLFSAFKKAVEQTAEGDSKRHPLSVVSKALHDLLGEDQDEVFYADAFAQLINALSDRGEGDSDGDGELTCHEANQLWPVLKARLYEEYSRSQGGFARLMFGDTKPESRRMIQLAFNRPNSFPKILVAQSMVGREGLNLHKACRTVVLLHPEWNPGVVEQQIGRVDRVGSHWESQLFKAIKEGCPAGNLPRIEVHPVIFSGTYDEHNWNVLRERWDDLRAQLHGVVIPPRIARENPDSLQIIEEIAREAPNFSPSSKCS